MRSLCVPLVMKHTYGLAGFPPIPGQNAADAEQGFVAALMAADKLISNDNVEAADEDDDEEEVGLPQRYTMSTFDCKLLTFFFVCFFWRGVSCSQSLLLLKSQRDRA